MLLLHSEIETQLYFKYRITFEYLIGLQILIVQRVGITNPNGKQDYLYI